MTDFDHDRWDDLVGGSLPSYQKSDCAYLESSPVMHELELERCAQVAGGTTDDLRNWHALIDGPAGAFQSPGY